MYVDGTQLYSLTDDSLVAGDPGLMIGTADPEDAVVLFDRFVVRQPWSHALACTDLPRWREVCVFSTPS